MPVFKDKNGKEWTLQMDLQTAWELEEYDFQGKAEKIQVVQPSEDLFQTRLLDVKTIFGICWVLCRKQAAEAMIDNELAFAKCFDGPAIARMKAAVWEVFIDFFPEMATTLKALIGKYLRVQNIANSRLTMEIETRLTDEEMDRIISEELAKMVPVISDTPETKP